MAAVVIYGMGKRMKDDNDDDKDSLSHSNNKKARVIWSDDLHAKFLDAVNRLGEQDAVPSKIADLMSVDGITTKHVASHLQKYRLRKKKAIHQSQTSTLLFPNKKDIHQSHTEIYSQAGFNMSGVAAPSTLTRLIQSQNINNNSLNIHPPPSTFPTHSQNIINRIDRMKEQEATGDDNDSLTCNKKACLVWSNDLHTKFVAAVNELGLHKAVPKKIVTLMNVQGITTAHVASHLQKYRLRKKKAADTVPAQIYSPSGLNITEVSPSTLIQSQNINNNSLNIHPPPSTFPTHSQNIHPSYNFPLNQTSTLLLPNKMPLHQSHTQIYSPTSFNMSGVTPSTLIRWPTQPQNINDSSSIIHPPPSTFPIYHQHTSTSPTLVNQSTTPFGFAAPTFDFHDLGTYVGSTSSKTTSIWDDDCYTKYLKRKPQSLQFPHNSLPALESDITSQNSQMNSQQTEPFMDGSASSLEDTNIDISDYNLCSENSPIDFSVEETNCNTLEWGCLEEDLINVWRCLEEENVLNVML